MNIPERFDFQLRSYGFCILGDTLILNCIEKFVRKRDVKAEIFSKLKAVSIEKKNEDLLYDQYSYNIATEDALKILRPYREQVKAKKRAVKKEREMIFEEAKRLNQPVLFYKYTDDCNDPDEDCELDIVYVYAMPDGSESEKRVHTW
jgi:hypothetical protein